MDNKKNGIPKLRFPGFTGAWEQRRLGEVAEINPSSEIPDNFEYVDLESVVGTEMIAYRRENKKTAPSRAQRLAKKGDIFYQTVRPYQKNNYHFNLTRKDFVFSTGYAQLRPNINGDFLFVYIQLSNFVNEVLNRSTGTSYPAISPSNLIRMKVAIPTNNEQEKIGAFFKQLDSLITLHQRKLEHLQEQKKGLLQKMFPKNGETVPEVRFPGFTDAWEQRKLGEIVEWSKGSGLSKDALNIQGIGVPVIHYADLYKFNSVQKEVIHWTMNNIGTKIPENNLLFPMSDVTPDGLARTSTVLQSNVKAGGDVLIAKLNKDILSTFMSYQINRNKNQILPLVTGTTVRHINSKSLSTLKVTVPGKNEQKYVGSILMRFDSLIALHQRKLEHLELMKKGLLQQMFV